MDIKIFKTDDATSMAAPECKAGLRVRTIHSNSAVDVLKSKLKKSISKKKSSELSQIEQMRAHITRLQEEKKAEIVRVIELREQNKKLKDDGVKIYNMYQTKINDMKQLGAKFDTLKEYTLRFEEEGLL